MLRIHTSTSSPSAKSYFSSADYYSQGQELVGLWRGEGAKRLGLGGEIGQAEWDRLCDNRDPATGKSLTMRRKDNRRVGWDFTFDVPKSVSLLYGLTGDERLLDAFRASVDETMQDMESEAQTRVRKDGANEDRLTGNLAWGQYVHFTSRPVNGVPDPQLHAHCFVFNATWDDRESRWKAAQIGDIKRDAPFHQAMFDARFARKLADLGLGVERTRTGWDLCGLDKSTLDKFSCRTAEIEALARKKGITNAKEKAQLGAKTRETKAKDLSMDELRDVWRSRLTTDEQDALARVRDRVGELSIAEDNRAVREAARLAIDHCLERSAVVPERTLLTEALKRSVGKAAPERVNAALSIHDLIRRQRDGRWFVTSQDVLKEEQRMLDFARAGRGTCRPLGTAHHVFKADIDPSEKELGPDQKKAVLHLLTSKDRIMVVRGPAGTGKTTMMTEAVAGIEAGGKQVFTFAPSAGASRGVLRNEGFGNAETVDHLLENVALQHEARDQVLWIDEAGLLSSRTTAKLFDLAKELNARIILSGDKRQHGSVERGGVLHLLESDAGIAPVELQDIRRQKGAYKAAVRALSEGYVKKGFERLDEMGWVQEFGDADRYRVLADAYVQSTREPGSTLVVSPTHLESERITQEIRSALKVNKSLGSTEQTRTILRPVHLTEAQRADALSYLPGDVAILHQNVRGHTRGDQLVVGRDTIPFDQPTRFTVYRPSSLAFSKGDRVRITKNFTSKDKAVRVNNGDLHTIDAIGKDGAITLDNHMKLPRSFGFLDYGYVVTSHASQGKSVDRVIIGQSSYSFAASSKEQFYVSVSRGKQKATIFTDDKRALLEAVSHGDERLTATDLVAGREADGYRGAEPERILQGPRRMPARRPPLSPEREAQDLGSSPAHAREREGVAHER